MGGETQARKGGGAAKGEKNETEKKNHIND